MFRREVVVWVEKVFIFVFEFACVFVFSFVFVFVFAFVFVFVFEKASWVPLKSYFEKDSHLLEAQVTL